MQVRFAILAKHDGWIADLLLRWGARPRPGASRAENPWRFASVSDLGCRRENNEDRCAVIVPSDPAICAAKGILAIVADGMGGHKAGEVASAMAVEIVSRRYLESPLTPRSALVDAFQCANHAIYTAGHADSARHMGTTCTALVIVDRIVTWAHIGDSRLYRLRRGKLTQLTEDDSEVGSLIRSGWMTESEARRHPQRNLLKRALGLDETVEPASPSHPDTARWGDVYLLCSDGLHDAVENLEIETILARSGPDDAANELIALARRRGGADNITAVVVSTCKKAAAAGSRL